MSLVVAVDGPAAAGKGTLARRLALALALPYLDTGLLYRAVARRVLDAGADPADPLAAEAEAQLLAPSDLKRADLRGPVMDAASSKVATVPGVRAALLAFQREFARTGAVLDGRDIGSVVLPHADVKLFVTAAIDERARRRHLELTAAGLPVHFEDILIDLKARDERDSHRSAAPLVMADDALLLDTSAMSPDEALAEAIRLVETRLAT